MSSRRTNTQETLHVHDVREATHRARRLKLGVVVEEYYDARLALVTVYGPEARCARFVEEEQGR